MSEEKLSFEEATGNLNGQLGLLSLRLARLEDLTELKDFPEVMAIRESLVLVAVAVDGLFTAINEEFVHEDDLPDWRDSNPPETDW